MGAITVFLIFSFLVDCPFHWSENFWLKIRKILHKKNSFITLVSTIAAEFEI